MAVMTKPVVSSAHLAAGGSSALSELEFGLNLAATAFHRWMARCATAAGATLSPLEVLILHTVRHRDRPKRLADVMLVLDIEDTHLATYALKKLAAAGFVTTSRVGKEKLITTTAEGDAFCQAYAAIREQLLVSGILATNTGDADLSQIAERLRGLSGQYNQAARAAATL